MVNNITKYKPSENQSLLDHIIFEDWTNTTMIRIIKLDYSTHYPMVLKEPILYTSLKTPINLDKQVT